MSAAEPGDATPAGPHPPRGRRRGGRRATRRRPAKNSASGRRRRTPRTAEAPGPSGEAAVASAGSATASPARVRRRGRRPAALAPRATWIALVAASSSLAFVLRIVGYKTGLPYVYNADENSHFVPRAIGMFGHSPNPELLHQPARLHVRRPRALHACAGGRTRRRSAARSRPIRRPRSPSPAPRRAFLGALAVALTAIAGARLFDDRRVGVLAGALLAVAFLPTPLQPLRAQRRAHAGAAGRRADRRRRHLPDRPQARVRARRGSASGVAIATKYTAGIVLVTRDRGGVRVAGRPRARAQPGVRDRADVRRASSPPTRTRCWTTTAFREGLEKQTETAGEDGGKLGLAEHDRLDLLPRRRSPGASGWLPSLFALGGAGALFARHRRLALLLAPAPVLLFLYLGQQSRFFARWMLPIYPILCLLAAWAVIAAATWLARRFSVALAIPALALSALVLLQGLVFSVHNDLVLAKADTRQVARDWMEQNIPSGDEHRRRADRARPVGDGRRASALRERRAGPAAATAGTSGARRAPASSTARRSRRAPARWSRSRTTSARRGPSSSRRYADGGFCWVVTGSTQFGRAYADPQRRPVRAAATTTSSSARARSSSGRARTGRTPRACRSPSTPRSITTR